MVYKLGQLIPKTSKQLFLMPMSGVRYFSSFSSVQGSSIQISSHYPPKLRIPVNDQVSYDITLGGLSEGETIAQIEAKILQNCGDHL